jgi:hypothetical protein
MQDTRIAESPCDETFRLGRSTGLAIAALALSIVSFISLLGAEKAILAIVLGLLAARAAAPGSLPRKLAVAAVSIAIVFLLTCAVIVVVYWDKLAELIQLLQKLS